MPVSRAANERPLLWISTHEPMNIRLGQLDRRTLCHNGLGVSRRPACAAVCGHRSPSGLLLTRAGFFEKRCPSLGAKLARGMEQVGYLLMAFRWHRDLSSGRSAVEMRTIIIPAVCRRGQRRQRVGRPRSVNSADRAICWLSFTKAPGPKHLSQIEGVHHAIPVEVRGTPLAWPPATQHDRQVKRFDLTVTIQVLRTLGPALVHEHTRHPFWRHCRRARVPCHGGIGRSRWNRAVRLGTIVAYRSVELP